MKTKQKTTKKSPRTVRRLIICFEEHFWVAKISSSVVGCVTPPKLVSFSPGAYRPADNPGGLSQTTCAPRRLQLRLKR